MGLVLRVIVSALMAACGGGNPFSSDGTSIDVELNVSNVQITEDINGAVRLAPDTTGTMCLVYSDVTSSEKHSSNGLWYVAEPNYYSGPYQPMNAPDAFKPVMSVYNSGTAENYRALCKDFKVDSSGSMAFFTQMNAGSPVFSTSATFKIHTDTHRYTGIVRVENLRLVAVTRNDPTKFYSTTFPIVSESCTSDHGDNTSCPPYSMSNFNLNFESYRFQASWPYSSQWMSGGVNWFKK